MRKCFKILASILIMISAINVVVFAGSASDLYTAEYENGIINIKCYVDDSYAGVPAIISLREKANPIGMPLYFNDSIIEQDGKVALSFKYELDNVNKYIICVNIAGAYTKDIPIMGGEPIVLKNTLSQFVYYADNSWNNLNTDTYPIVAGGKTIIGVTIPDKDSCVVMFATKDNNGRLLSAKSGEAYESNKYRASVDVPKDGTVEIYCWDSLSTMNPCCEKAVLPNDCAQTILFSENPEPIIENPGKGWVRYRSDYAETDDVLEYVSVGYNRFNWNQIEPTEGKYDWSVIEEFIDKWDKSGKKAAFGIACASSTNSATYLTPKWVFDAGAAYTMSNSQYVPVWNDPIFLQKLDNFTKAFAEKYDGDPRIAFIDIRSYGNFGETHTSELSGSASLSAEEEKKHLDIAKKYFKETQLIVCTANNGEQGIKTEYAVDNGIGLRLDAILSGNYSETHKLDDAYGKEPTVFEFVNSYTNMKNAADSYGQASNDNGHWNEDRYLLSFFVGKPSYMDLGQYNNDSQSFLSDNRELVELLSNKMGYHFVLKSMNIPKKISAGETITLDATWMNKGIAPLYEDCYPAIAILDAKGRVIDKYWLDGFNPENWLPKEDVTETANAVFSMLSGDSVKLALGLFSKKTDLSPSYKIGNYNATKDNWYIIATGSKEDDGYILTPVNQPEQVKLNTKLEDFYNGRMSQFYDREPSANIISDSTFELANCNWYPVKNLSKVEKSTSNPHSGSYCGVISDRSDLWSGAQIDITNLLKQNGAGTYRFEGWFRTPISFSSRKLNVYPFRINSVTEYTITAEISNSWTKISGDIEISEEQIEKMTHAVTLILGDDRGSYYNSKDIYFDDITLTKIK